MIFPRRCSIALAFLMFLCAARLCRAEAPVEFLDLKAAKAAIVDDADEPYFSKLNAAEIAGRTGQPVVGEKLEAARADCRRRYQEGVREFTAAEQEMLRWYVARIGPMVKDYPAYADVPWSFIKVSNSVEAGMPHTRGKHIVLSEVVLGLLAALKAQNADSAMAFGGDVLIHEKSHVFQRYHPKLMAGLYANVWHYRQATVKSDAWIDSRQVTNPDGIVCDWVYGLSDSSWIWPLIILKDPDHPSLEQMRMVAVELTATEKGFAVKADADGKPVVHDLMKIKEYREAFAPSGNIYHPNETEADLFASMVVDDDRKAHGMKPLHSGDGKDLASQHFDALRAWCRKNMGSEGKTGGKK
jgi:hypothetical protein